MDFISGEAAAAQAPAPAPATPAAAAPVVPADTTPTAAQPAAASSTSSPAVPAQQSGAHTARSDPDSRANKKPHETPLQELSASSHSPHNSGDIGMCTLHSQLRQQRSNRQTRKVLQQRWKWPTQRSSWHGS